MGVTSGVIPYEYAGPLPFLIRPEMDPIGFSGVLFEHAHFVLAAEIRRWSKRFGPTGDNPVFKYVNKPASVSEASEASGTFPHFLTTPTSYPGGANYVDQILDMRSMFNSMMIDIFLDSDYNLSDIKADWLNNACPNPSGANGDFRRREPDIATETDELGRILSLAAPQEEILGFSGVLYDIDLCEMRYQPYPRLVATRFQNVYNSLDSGGGSTGHEFILLTQPIWPAFHKSDGSLVSLNSRDASLGFSNPNRVIPFQVGRVGGAGADFFHANGTGYDSVGSGLIQIDGDALLDLTDYKLALSGQNFASSWTFNTHGSRKLGKSEDGTNGVGRVYVTPTAKAEGLYFVGLENTRDNVPFGVIPSGFVSKWPNPIHMEVQPWQNTSPGGQLGFEVINEAFWVLANGAASVTPTSRPPSGLALASPLTGTYMWLRFADMQETASQNWGDHVGLERIASNRIIRLTDTVFDDGAGDQLAFVEYNDNLDFVAENRVDATSATTLGPPNPTSFFHDPDNGWLIMIDEGFATSGRDLFVYDDTTFAFVQSYEGGSSWLKNGARLNAAYWGWNGGEAVARHVQKFELLIPGTGTPNVNRLETKIVQVEVIPGLSGVMGSFGVSDAKVISGATTVNNGIWFLCTGSSGAFLLRVMEDITAWVPQEAIKLHPSQVIGQFIYMPIN